MKLNLLFNERKIRIPYKYWLAMKLTVLLIITTIFQLHASSFAQNITLNKQNAALEKILVEVSKQSGYNFLYNTQMLQNTRPVSINVKNAALNDVLDRCFSGQPVTYLINNNTVIVSKRPEIQTTVSQDITIEGTVSDAKGEPLVGVTVKVKGTSTGVTTNASGQYRIRVPDGSNTLVFSYIGFSNKEVEINGQTTINVSLAEEASMLAEVVVGYGRQRKINLTGAVSTIKSEAIEDRPLTDATQALAGAAPGVFVNQNSGLAGQDESVVRIRGIGTLNNTNPLILIDGIEGPLSTVDPNDIASISVLKDAASAAIYGSRASNGVVLVTTKRGGFNKKPSLTYSGYYGLSEATRLPDMVNDAALFMELANEAKINNGSLPKFTQAQIDKYRAVGPNTNWFDEVFRTAPIHQHNFTLSGGGESISYLFSGGLQDQDAITPNTNNKRYNVRINLDSKVSSKLSIGSSLFFTRRQIESPLSDIIGGGGDDGIISKVLQAPPIYPAYDSQGRFATADQSLSITNYMNPLAFLNFNEHTSNRNQFLGNVFAEYELIPGLKLKGTFALNYLNNYANYFALKGDTYDWQSGSALIPSINPQRGRELFHSNSNYVTSWIQATYEKSIGEHKFNLLAGANQESYKYTDFEAARSGFPTNTVRAMSAGNASTSTNGEDITDWALRSVFGRLNYNFDERYLFEFTLRRDGSSRFGAANRYGVFPSVSAGWVLTNEKFFTHEAVDLLKLRASWGQLGNQYAATDYPFAGQVGLNSNYNFNGSLVQGAAQTTFNNPDIRWETTSTTNFGVDAGLFKKLTFEGDYFVRTTKDILYALPLPATAGGLATPVVNTGKVRNRGWEASAAYNEKAGQVSFSIGFNVTNVNSEVLYIDPSKSAEGDIVNNGQFILQRGEALNSIYGLKAIGIFQDQAEIDNSPTQQGNYAPGDLKFADLDGSGEIDNRDRTIIGREDPKWLYGANLNLAYKGFDLSMIAQGTGDFQSYAGLEYFAPFFSESALSAQWLDRWTPENRTSKMPRLFYSDGPNNASVNSFWIQNRSYFRLKNVQLGYNLPSSLTRKIRLDKVRLYVNAQNLITITKFNGFDPEKPEGLPRGGSGYPLLKIYTTGLNITF